MIRTAIVYIANGARSQKGDIVHVYSGEPNPEVFALEWKDATKTRHVIIPIDADHRALRAVFGAGGEFVRLETDPSKVADLKSRGKQAMISEAYHRLDKDLFDRLEFVFGTRRTDSAIAFAETWRLMDEKPELFLTMGMRVDRTDIGMSIGAPLNTVELIRQYASARKSQAEAFVIFRIQRIVQFQIERAQIIAAP